MSSDSAEEAASAAAGPLLPSNAAAKPQATSPRASEADSDLNDSSPKRRKSSSDDREVSIALQNKGQQALPYDDEAPPLPDEAPPLPDEAPPLPQGPPPGDDGWSFAWDYDAQRWYYTNSFTGHRQWENPRVSEATAPYYGSYDRYGIDSAVVYTTSSGAPGTSSPPKPKRKYGGYNPAIHGNYDPNADYAREAEEEEEELEAAALAPAFPAGDYSSTAHFNRFTGRFQHAENNPEYHNDENKSKRQMNAFFDVDAAANSHDGRSLKAERRGKTLTKKELQAFKEKRREKKEEKRRAWLRD